MTAARTTAGCATSALRASTTTACGSTRAWGRSNYRAFFLSLVAAAAFLMFHAAVVAYCLAALSGSDAWTAAVSAVYGEYIATYGGKTLLQALLALALCLHTCALLPVVHLLALHLWLSCNGLTTYEWIMQSRAKTASAAAEEIAPAGPAVPMHSAEKAEKTLPVVDPEAAAVSLTAADENREPVVGSFAADQKV